MADNIAITAGSGTNIGTDDVVGVHFQQVKLMDPSLDSSNPISTGSGEIGTNTLRVVIATDSVNPVRAIANSGVDIGDVDILSIPTIETKQVSGANDSVSVTNVVTISATDLDIRDLVNLSDSISAYQVSGANWSIEVASQPVTFDVKQVSGSINSVNVVSTVGLTDTELRVATVDVRQVSGSVDSTVVNSFLTSLEVKQVSGFSDSVSVVGMPATTVVMGDIYSDAVDVDSAPQKVGGIARTANPAAVANGDRVSATYDDLGRQLIRPIQVRDLIRTAYVQKTSGSTFGTETSFIAGTASEFHDLVYVMASNNSDAATLVDIRSGTGGAVVMTLDIPPGAVVGVAPAVPIPQPEVAQAWTIDLPDITGTTISITGLFSIEI